MDFVIVKKVCEMPPLLLRKKKNVNLLLRFGVNTSINGDERLQYDLLLSPIYLS